MGYQYNFDNVDTYVADTSQKRKISKTLEKGIHEVVWNSHNGTKTMQVTLDDKHIPGSLLLSESGVLFNQTHRGAETVRAYSVDRQGWRSFNVKDVVSITKVSK